MPSDSNGVFSLISGYLATTGETIQASQHNPPLEDIASAMTGRMMRSGVSPMTGPLKIVDGSVSSPAVQLNTASGTGLYKTVNGIGIAINGVKAAEVVAGGLVLGARWFGELIPFTGLTAPALTVFPYGQTLSRTTYADLWAFAQTEIAGGNTFYNNGNGSTTFGIGDLRGRGVSCKDDMGGSAASRLTTAGGGVDGATLGAVGGTQNGTIAQGNLPAATLTTTINDPGHAHSYAYATIANQAGNQAGWFGLSTNTLNGSNSTGSSTTGITASTALGGSGTAFKIMQPTIVTNYVLFAGGPA